MERFTPPAIAVSQSFLIRLSHARYTDVREDEHMVSSARLGPVKL